MNLEESITRGTEVRQLRAENEKLRSKLLEIAGECSGCGGTGCVTVPPALRGAFGNVIPCADCEDIREALA